MSYCRNQGNSVKQYSTVEILCKYKDDDGLPLSLAGMVIRSDMNNSSGRRIDSLEVSVVDELGGVFLLKPTLNKLPVDKLSIDVLFEKDGKRVTSDTFNIDVEVAITEPMRGV